MSDAPDADAAPPAGPAGPATPLPSDGPSDRRRPSPSSAEGRLLRYMAPQVLAGLSPEQRAEIAATVVRALEQDPRVIDELYMNRLDARHTGLRRALARLGWRFRLTFGVVAWTVFVRGDRRHLNRWVDRAFALLVLVGLGLGYFFLAYLIKRNILGIDLFPRFHLWQ